MKLKETIKQSVHRNVIVGVAVALILSIGTACYDHFRDSGKEIVYLNGIRNTLENYANDINNDRFSASSYFSSDVKQFFEISGTTPRKIDLYWKNEFERLFRETTIRFDFNTLHITSINENEVGASVIMHSDYFNTNQQKQYNDEVSRYDLIFDSEYRIVHIMQVIPVANNN